MKATHKASFRLKAVGGRSPSNDSGRRLTAAIVLFCATVWGTPTARGQSIAPALDTVYHLYVTQDYDRGFALLGRLEAALQKKADLLAVRLEIGDFLLDKEQDYQAAESVYSALLESYPKDRLRADILYRLALAQELQEKFLESAQSYEEVATRYMKSRYGADALDAIERCFRKNYQDRVAYVNGYPLTRIELDDRISRNPAAYEPYEKKQGLLDTMVDNRLLCEAALKAGVTEDPEFLAARREARNRMLFEEWYEREVNAKAEPKEKDIKATYRKEKASRHTTPEKVRAYQIVVPTLVLAESLRQVVLADTSVVWDSLAKLHSTAPDKERGGDLGLFARGVHPREVERAAFSLKPGEVSKPAKTDDGYVLLKVTEKRPQEVRTFDQVRNQILVQLRQENLGRLYEEASGKLKEKAVIVTDSNAVAENQETLAVVNGAVVDRAALEKRLEAIPGFYRAQFETPEGRQRILDQLILESLILVDCEAKKVWLWNRVVDKLLARDNKLVLDYYRKKMTTDLVKLDSSELKADYGKTIDEFRVPAQVRAREVTAPNRKRARELRGWAEAGRIPALIAGRALLVTDAARAPAVAETLAMTANADSLVALWALTDSRGLLPNTPVIRVGNRSVPDLGKAAPLAGPFESEATFGFAFADVGESDELYLPELKPARDASELSQVLSRPLETDTTGALVLDSNQLGTYVALSKPMPPGSVKRLFGLKVGETAEPEPAPDGILVTKVTKSDSAQKISFQDLARRFSSSNTKWSGGDMNWLTKDDQSRDRKVLDAAFSLPKGSMSQLIQQADSSFTFIQVEDKKKASVRPFEEVRAKIENKLRQAREKELSDQLIKDLRASASIEVLMKESDFLFETEEPAQPSEVPATEEQK